MAIITKSDGVLLSVNSTRTKYQNQKKTELDKVIKYDAEEFGIYVRVEKQGSSTAYVSYSKEGGAATGEYIQSLLPDNQSVNAIYAEILRDESEKEHYVCVLIVDGRVVGDFDLTDPSSYEQLGIQFSSYPEVKFNIFSAVESNLVKAAGAGSDPLFFELPSHQIGETITVLPFLKNSQIDDLEKFQHISINDYLKQKKSRQRKRDRDENNSEHSKNLTLKNIISVFIIIGGLWFIYSRFSGEEVEHQADETQIDPYLKYKNAISVMYSPVKMLNETMEMIYVSSKLGGWEVDSFSIEGNIFEIKLRNQGGDISGLKQIKDEFGEIAIRVDNQIVLVTGSIDRFERSFPYVIYRIDEIEYLLYDQAVIKSNFVLTNVGDTGETGYMMKQFNVESTNATIKQIQEFAVFLRDKPIVVNKVVIIPGLTGAQFSMSLTLFGGI